MPSFLNIAISYPFALLQISVWRGSCSNLICVTGNDDYCRLKSSVTFSTTIAETYYIFVHGYSSRTGTYELQLSGLSAPDPTPPPTRAPTVSPSLAPSDAPSVPKCFLEASIGCRTISGHNCHDLSYREGDPSSVASIIIEYVVRNIHEKTEAQLLWGITINDFIGYPTELPDPGKILMEKKGGELRFVSPVASIDLLESQGVEFKVGFDVAGRNTFGEICRESAWMDIEIKEEGASVVIEPETPTMEPSCQFDMDIECVPPAGSTSCNATLPPVEQCQGRPFEMVFLYNGGDCDQSYNVQEAAGKFFCEDFQGGPPTARGEKSFIVVTALKDDILYHSDWVEVGSLFTLFDGGENFVADQIITIYNSDNTADANNIIQSVQYHSSCSQNLFLKDRFGATQLVIWVNEDQGVVSCFANQTFNLDITVPIELQGGPATVTSLTVASNVDPFFFNLTDRIAGTVVDAGDSLQTSFAIPIDLTIKRTYNLLLTLSAVTADGRDCHAAELMTFIAGYPLPPIFPTLSPTQAPSIQAVEERPDGALAPPPTPDLTPPPTPQPTLQEHAF